jgi:predicted nuclease with TOPRIM domain
MRALSVICIIFLLAFMPEASAQVVDSLSGISQEMLEEKLAAKTQLQFSTDSLKINSWSESLKSKITNKFSSDSLNYQNKIDSLQNLNLPFDQYSSKLDSISQKKDQLINEVSVKRDQLLTQTKGRLEKWKNKVQEKIGGKDLAGKLNGDQLSGKVSNVTDKIEGLDQNIPDLDGKIPDLNSKLPDLDNRLGDLTSNVPKLDANLPDLNSGALSTDALGAGMDLPEMPQLSTPELKDLSLSTDLSSINEKLSFDGLDKLEGLQDKIGGASGQLSALKNASSNPDAAIESTLKNVDQLSAVQEQLDGMEAVKDNEFVEMAEKMKDPEAMKAEAKEIIVLKAVNHFAGKEAVLQEAMNKMAKYKNKYESLNSLSDIKNLPKNAMKGKPFRERIIPGVGMQILKNENLLLDVNPYAGYRITGRFNGGLGWNQRIGYSLDNNYFTSVSVIYGPRFFTELKTWKGFIARAEFEVMNTEVPSSLRLPSTDTHSRQWVKTVFVGIKKEYQFIKRVRGTAFMMFSIYNDHRKSPYGDVVNSRFGFEFPLKKQSKVKKS